jgi:hypothetical protein
MANVKKLSEDEVKKNLIHAKVNNNELNEIRRILAISECVSMSDLIRTSIFFYGSSLKEGSK